MQQIKYVKQPVAVIVAIDRDGQVRPKKFQWKDGHTYPIDRVCKADAQPQPRLVAVASDTPLW